MVTKQELLALAADNVRNDSLSVGTTAVLISPYLADSIRKGLIITNTSSGGQVITIAKGKPAVANQGVVLTAFGSSYVEAITEGYVPSLYDIWAISSAAGGTIAIQETILKV